MTVSCARPTAHWRRFKIQRQASAPSVSTGRVTDACYQRLHSQTSNTHAAVHRSPLHTWQSFETWGQDVKMASSSESSDEDDNLVLFWCWCWCCNVGERRKGPQKKKNGLELNSSFKISSLLRSANFDVSTWCQIHVNTWCRRLSPAAKLSLSLSVCLFVFCYALV